MGEVHNMKYALLVILLNQDILQRICLIAGQSSILGVLGPSHKFRLETRDNAQVVKLFDLLQSLKLPSVKLLCLGNWQEDLVKEKLELVFRKKLSLTKEDNDPEVPMTESIESMIESVFRRLVSEDDKLKILKGKLNANKDIERSDDKEVDTSYSLLDC